MAIQRTIPLKAPIHGAQVNENMIAIAQNSMLGCKIRVSTSEKTVKTKADILIYFFSLLSVPLSLLKFITAPSPSLDQSFPFCFLSSFFGLGIHSKISPG